MLCVNLLLVGYSLVSFETVMTIPTYFMICLVTLGLKARLGQSAHVMATRWVGMCSNGRSGKRRCSRCRCWRGDPLMATCRSADGHVVAMWWSRWPRGGHVVVAMVTWWPHPLLQETAVSLSDPFGGDAVDFETDQFMASILANAKSLILADSDSEAQMYFPVSPYVRGEQQFGGFTA